MHLTQWKQFSTAQRESLMKLWDTSNRDGYWHALNSEVVDEFRKIYGSDARIRHICGGVFHGGSLIIGVSKNIPWDEMLDIPEFYFGFRVIQLGTESKKKEPNQALQTTIMADTPAAAHPSRQP